MPLTYRAAVDQLFSLADFERKSRANQPPDWHVKRVHRLMEILDAPHLATPVVHVAGTKGKGSTCAMVASALSAAGYRTGFYSSPSLHRVTERIQVDGRPIPESDFAALVDRLWPVAERIHEAGDLGVVSVFEMLTAMAFVYYRDVKADLAVIEVGLGGRLDATNVVQPAVTAITPVSLDHTSILGDSIALIAREKAGIIKPGVPVVMSGQFREAADVVRSVAATAQSPLTEAFETTRLVSDPTPSTSGHDVHIATATDSYRFHLPLLGLHQIDNARTAIAVLEILRDRGFSLPVDAVCRGLSGVRWPARVQLVTQGPPIVIADGAHNEQSAIALVSAIERHFPGRRGVVLVYGVTRGHDHESTARALSQLGVRFIATQSRHPRTLDAESLAEALETVRIDVQGIAATVADALALAKACVAPGDIVVACGSLFVAAEAIEEVTGIEPEIYPGLTGPITQPYLAAVPQPAP